MTLSRKVFRAFALGLLALLLAVLAADCVDQGGMHQGPDDDVPSWRK